MSWATIMIAVREVVAIRPNSAHPAQSTSAVTALEDENRTYRELPHAVSSLGLSFESDLAAYLTGTATTPHGAMD